MRWYLHVDIDVFSASVEQVLDPALKDKDKRRSDLR